MDAFAVILLILPLSTTGQSASTDSQTLQALLAEVRQLRQELRTTSISAQRAQILIYRVQAQQTVITRLSQQVDTERSRLSQDQSEQKRMSAATKRLEELRSSQSEAERKEKQTDEQLAQIKLKFDQLSNEEQETQARKIALEDELHLDAIETGSTPGGTRPHRQSPGPGRPREQAAKKGFHGTGHRTKMHPMIRA
jgi:chromosome segregation ATPase